MSFSFGERIYITDLWSADEITDAGSMQNFSLIMSILSSNLYGFGIMGDTAEKAAHFQE